MARLFTREQDGVKPESQTWWTLEAYTRKNAEEVEIERGYDAFQWLGSKPHLRPELASRIYTQVSAFCCLY